jgi:hypothetical protein
MLLKDIISEKLQENNLTLDGIYEEMKDITTKASVKTTLTRMKKKGLIIVKGFKDGSSIYALNPDLKDGKNAKKLRKIIKFYDDLFAKNRKVILADKENKQIISKNRDLLILAKSEIAKLKNGD